MKKLILFSLLLLSSNLFGQTLMTEYRFDNSVSNINNIQPFAFYSGTMSYVTDRNANANSAVRLAPSTSTFSNFQGPTGTNSRSISIWYKLTSNSGNPVIFSYGNNIQYQQFGIYIGANGNPVFWGNNYDYNFGGSYGINTWHHLVLTFDGTDVQLYMNGSPAGNISRPLLNTPAGNFLLNSVGSAGNIDYDDLKIYSGVLTASQVNQLFTANILNPTTAATQNFCSATNPTVASLTTTMGTNIQWYASQIGGSPLVSTTPLSTGTYWCSQTVAGLESGRSSKSVTITVGNPTVPTFMQVAPICQGSTFTLPTTSNNGIAGTWTPAINTSATTTYTFTSNACSPTATMTVNVISAPLAPGSTPNVSYTVGQTAVPLTVGGLAGSTFNWYTQAVGGVGSSTAPTPITSVASITNYWVSQTNNGCEGPRTKVTVTVGNNNYLHFDGANDYSSASSTNEYPSGNSNYTIEMWVAPSFSVDRSVLLLGDIGSNIQTEIIVSTDRAVVNWGGSNTLIAYFPNSSTWTHVATTWDGSTRKIFINGVLAGSDTPSTHNTTNWRPIQLGTGTTGGFYWGGLDEVRIYNVVRTQAEIQEKMYCEITNSTVGLQQYWRFNQGTPGGNNTSITHAVNEMMNGSNELLQNFALTGTTSNFLNGSPMSGFIAPTFSFPSPFYVCQGSSYTLPTTSNNGIIGTWSPVFNSATIGATSYTFTPNSGQCSTPISRTVAITNTPTATTFTQVAPICAGAPLAALPTQSLQGNPGTWSPAINNMATTTYTFTPNNGICANTATMTITVNPATLPTFAQVAPVCMGTSFTLPTTSTNGITGTWAPAINTSATTTYTFTPTAGQCASTTTMTVTVNSSGVTPTFTQVAAVCSGSTLASLPTTSNNSIVGTWSPAINNTATTTYTFTPSAGVCPATATMTISINPTPAAPAVTTPVLYATGATTSQLTATGTNLLWYTSAVGGTGSTTAPTPSSAVSGSFSYWVSQTGANGCESPRSQITVSVGGTNCLHFDGVNDYINFNPGITAPTGNSSYTIEAMINLQSIGATYQQIIGWGTQGTNSYNRIIVNNAEIRSSWWNNDLSIPFIFNLNTWYHIAATWDGTTRKLYINGVQIGSDSPSSPNILGTDNARIGRNGVNSAEFFAGRMDEVRIWNIARTQAQVQEKMFCEIQTSPTMPGLMSYFSFNSGVGGGNNAGVVQLVNEISGAVPGALVGFALSGATSNWINQSPVFGLTLPSFTNPGSYCAGATIPALPTTSNNGITGTWSPAMNNMATTTYTFTPSAGQCAYLMTMSIDINPSVTPAFTQVAPICAGATLAALPTTSTNGVAGTWSPAINNMATTTYTFTPSAAGCFTPTTMTITVNPVTTPTFTQVAPICAGVSLAITSTSLEGITGTWTPALNNTMTTTYTFTPTAGQCSSASTTMTITVNPNVTSTFTQVAPICEGETISLTNTSIEGNSGTWSPAINNMVTTDYTFTPSGGTCVNTGIMTITVNPPTTPAFTQVSPVCLGNSIAALPTTSNNGIDGSWSPAIDDQNTTTYTFTPDAGQCANPNTMTIIVTTTPITPSFAAQNAICEGELFTLSTTSNEGVTGTWSPAIDNMNTTTYTFTPTVGECADPTTMTVTVNPQPAAPSGNTVQTFVPGATIADVVVAPVPVTWYLTNQDALASTNPLIAAYELVDGASYFAVYSANGCSSVPFEVVIQITAGIGDDKSAVDFAMYPNPTSSEVTIVGLSIGSSITLLDASGRKIQYMTTRAEEEILNVTSCTEGVYFVQIQTASGDIATKKLIVRK